jgi:hypothetical protein
MNARLRLRLRPTPRFGLALLAAALVAATGSACAPPARARVTIGIGQQTPELFTSRYWRALRAPHVRYVAPWDAMGDRRQRAAVDAYMAAAKRAGAKVMIGFEHSLRTARSAKVLPSSARFKRAFRAWHKRYPRVRDWIPWNEANGVGGLTWKRADRAAAYFNVATRVCRRCNIVAGDVLDVANMTSWIRRFLSYTRTRPRIWGLHNYRDANYLSSSATRRLLRLVRGQIWFTETGGVVRMRVRVHGRIHERNYGIQHAARATRHVLNLARLSPRITRIYLYHWRAPTKFTTWDSALLDARLRPRPGYRALLAWLTGARRSRLATHN